MKLSELKTNLEKKGNILYKGFCHDCKKSVEVSAKIAEDGTIQIEGGATYKVKQGLEDVYLFKCDECFRNDPTLRNFRECEVYSRVVGYLRPVKQWNKGKKEEYKMRTEFKNLK